MTDEQQPRILNTPEEIWLVYGDVDYDSDHNECRDVSWCNESQFPSDVRYIRADKAEQTDWIKPSERLPEPGDLIAVKWFSPRHYDYDSWVFIPTDDGFKWDDIACWIKLPKP